MTGNHKRNRKQAQKPFYFFSLDLSGAFDTANHQILMKKIEDVFEEFPDQRNKDSTKELAKWILTTARTKIFSRTNSIDINTGVE